MSENSHESQRKPEGLRGNEKKPPALGRVGRAEEDADFLRQQLGESEEQIETPDHMKVWPRGEYNLVRYSDDKNGGDYSVWKNGEVFKRDESGEYVEVSKKEIPRDLALYARELEMGELPISENMTVFPRDEYDLIIWIDPNTKERTDYSVEDDGTVLINDPEKKDYVEIKKEDAPADIAAYVEAIWDNSWHETDDNGKENTFRGEKCFTTELDGEYYSVTASGNIVKYYASHGEYRYLSNEDRQKIPEKILGMKAKIQQENAEMYSAEGVEGKWVKSQYLYRNNLEAYVLKVEVYASDEDKNTQFQEGDKIYRYYRVSEAGDVDKLHRESGSWYDGDKDAPREVVDYSRSMSTSYKPKFSEWKEVRGKTWGSNKESYEKVTRFDKMYDWTTTYFVTESGEVGKYYSTDHEFRPVSLEAVPPEVRAYAESKGGAQEDKEHGRKVFDQMSNNSLQYEKVDSASPEETKKLEEADKLREGIAEKMKELTLPLEWSAESIRDVRLAMGSLSLDDHRKIIYAVIKLLFDELDIYDGLKEELQEHVANRRSDVEVMLKQLSIVNSNASLMREILWTEKSWIRYEDSMESMKSILSSTDAPDVLSKAFEAGSDNCWSGQREILEVRNHPIVSLIENTSIKEELSSQWKIYQEMREICDKGDATDVRDRLGVELQTKFDSNPREALRPMMDNYISVHMEVENNGGGTYRTNKISLLKAEAAARQMREYVESASTPEERRAREIELGRTVEIANTIIHADNEEAHKSIGKDYHRDFSSLKIYGVIYPEIEEFKRFSMGDLLRDFPATRKKFKDLNLPECAILTLFRQRISDHGASITIRNPEQFKDDPLAPEILKHAINSTDEFLSIDESYSHWKEKPWAEEVLFTLARRTHEGYDSQSERNTVAKFIVDEVDEPLAEKLLRTMVQSDPRAQLLHSVPALKKKPYYKNVLMLIALASPYSGFTEREEHQQNLYVLAKVKEKLEASKKNASEKQKESIEKSLKKIEEQVKEKEEEFNKLDNDKKDRITDLDKYVLEHMPENEREQFHQEYHARAKKVRDVFKEIKGQMTVEERLEKSKEELSKLIGEDRYKALQQGLDEFNKERGLAIECVDVSDGGYFVFINTGVRENGEVATDKLPYIWNIPVIAMNGPNPSDFKDLFERTYQHERDMYITQYDRWENPDNQKYLNFDLPKGGKTGVIYINAPAQIPGTDTDVARNLDIYREDFEAEVLSVNADNKKRVGAALRRKGFRLGREQLKGATTQEIKESITASMQEAVDRGMEAVVLHYLMHGGLKGEVGTSDGEIGVKEILTAMRQPYNGPDTSKKGKPLISLIEHVVLRSESCLSGNQEHEYVKELEGENFEGIPVENVWIAMSSSPYTFSLAGAIPETTPLTSEEMRGDLSGYLSYFNSYHDELMDVIRKRCPNGELPKELSTFNRVNMFIDLATRKSTQGHVQLLFKYDDDSQDMQGRYFRRKEKADGETEKIDNKYSKLDGEMEIFA